MSAAWRLRELGIDTTVLEARNEPGGRMSSRKFGDIWVDKGAEILGSSEKDLLSIVDAIGLADEKIVIGDGPIKFHIKRGSRYHEVAFGSPLDLLRTGAFSWRGKMRLPLLLPSTLRQMWRLRRTSGSSESWRGAWADDESMESWLQRVNPEFLEYFSEPFLQLMCGWEAEEVSKGWLIYTNSASVGVESFSFKEGLGQFTRALGSHLNVKTGCRVTRIEAGSRPVVQWIEDGRIVDAEVDGVVVAVEGSRVRELVFGLDHLRQEFLDGVRYVPHSLVFFRLKKEVPPLPADCIYFPRSEDSALVQLSYQPYHTSPDGERLLRVSTRAPFEASLQHLDDDAYLDACQKEVARYAPKAMSVIEDRYTSRWDQAIPVFPPGYLRALEQFLHLSPAPGLAFAGDYLGNCSVGAAFRTGKLATDDLVQRL